MYLNKAAYLETYAMVMKYNLYHITFDNLYNFHHLVKDFQLRKIFGKSLYNVEKV